MFSLIFLNKQNYTVKFIMSWIDNRHTIHIPFVNPTQIDLRKKKIKNNQS